MATLEPDEEVLILAPYFGVYKDIVLLLGGKPVKVDCDAENGFRLSPETLSGVITAKTRWLILNLPSNPAGVTYSESDLKSLGKTLRNHPRVLTLSDEIYEHIIFDNQAFLSFAKVCPDLKPQILTVNGVSKAYAMTGWRIGYAGGPAELIAAMTKVQSQVSSAPCSIAQATATAALSGPQDDVEHFRRAYEARREVLLHEAHVAVVPGSAYGMSPYFRISTASSETLLASAMERISIFLSKFSKS